MSKATDLLRKGAELARQHKWHEGVDVYLQATEKDPTDSHCWLGLGVCLFRVGNFGMARVALDRSERMGHPKAGKALAWLEDAERLQGIVKLKRLLLSPASLSVAEIMEPDVHSVQTDLDQEEVARVMERYDMVSLPVVDNEGKLVNG